MPSLTEVGSLYIAIRASADGLKGDIQNAVDDAKSVMEKGASALAVTLGATLAAGMAAVSAAFIKGYQDIDNLSAAAAKLGTSTAGLAELQYAAESTDVAFEKVADAVGKMGENLAIAASEGKGAAFDALKQLGLDAATLRKLAPEDQLAEIADRLKDINNTGTRAVLASNIFGKAGPDMNAFFALGKSGIEEMTRQAQTLGLTLSEAAVAGVAEFDKLEVVIQNAGKGFFRQFTAELAPAFKGLSDSLLQAIQQMGGMQSIAQATANAVVEIAAFLADAANGAKLVFDYMQAWFASLVGIAAATNNWIETTQLGIVSKIGGAIREVGENLTIISVIGTREANKLIESVNTAIRAVVAGIRVMVDLAFQGILESWNKLPFVDKVPTGGSISGAIPAPSIPLLPETPPTDDSTAAALKLLGGDLEAVAQDQIQASNDLTNAALDEANARRDAANATLQQIKAGDSWGNQVRANITANRAAIAAQTAEAIKGQKIGSDALMKTADEASKAADEASKAGKAISDSWDESLKGIWDTNQRTVVDIATAWATGTGKMSDIFAQWGQSVIRQLIQISLFGSKLSNGTTGVSGLIPSLLGAGTSSGSEWLGILKGVGSLFGGFFADGGDITGGKAYVVGERGPEVFRPRGSGTIIPNHKLRSMGGGRVMGGGDAGPPVVINQMFQSGITRAEVASMIDQVDDRTRAAVLTAHNQGGSFRRTLRS